MRKIFVSFVIIVGCVLIAFGGALGYLIAMPNYYDQTFLAAMIDKVERLHSVDEPKIVLIGGSSMCFGIDSEALERELNMPVVDMGLYAALGTKATATFAQGGINRGDIVVFAPELDSQAYSMYFDGESVLQAVDGKPSLALQLSFSDMVTTFYSAPSYITQKKKIAQTGISVSPMYSRAAFNEYGDIKIGDSDYKRTHNIMPLSYLPDSNLITVNKNIVSDDFIEYINEYTQGAYNIGATVYWSFPPVNELALTDTTDESIQEFFEYLAKSLTAEVISYPSDYVLDSGYFYDSNYHLNDSGVPLRTYNLVNDIKRAIGAEGMEKLGITPTTNITVPPPSGNASVEPNPEPDEPNPEPDEPNPEPDDTENLYFVYTNIANGVSITGLTDEGKKQTELTVPKSIDGKAVTYIANRAFADEKTLQSITVPHTVGYGDRLFENSSVTALNIVLSNDISVAFPSVGADLLGGNDNIQIYVSSNRHAAIVGDYFWSKYSGRIQVAS